MKRNKKGTPVKIWNLSFIVNYKICLLGFSQNTRAQTIMIIVQQELEFVA